ncbi:ATPase [Heliobacterium gestii]|uniref:ATPase n=1 Tax=Heliomicrobium gestii TaxID=2699 RepID=A0A845LJF7_HELGE|nr:ATPase [Heliomicrobium gestii]MBM7867032.1 cell division septum initiation protein DivIVA [Heliomicrobium gestii]MZP43553.1 ATPase [Heliomicrobium gestii]
MERAQALEGNSSRFGEGRSVLRILDELEELIETSTRIPITGKVLVDDHVLLDFLDRIRTGLPEELRQAKWLTKERQRVIQEAEAECQQMIEETKVYVAKLAGETEIVRLAQQKSEEILAEARRQAVELHTDARQYADDVLRQIEHTLTKSVSTVRKGREELQAQWERGEEEF